MAAEGPQPNRPINIRLPIRVNLGTAKFRRTKTAPGSRKKRHGMKYPKRLIEVDLPIRRISAHARREKSIRHGHISTLHIWWARRPLAACRAVVCASLWPDPGDELCPPRFISTAKRLMTFWAKDGLADTSEDSFPRFNKINNAPSVLDNLCELRLALLDFIADFANWDNSTNERYLAVARTLTVAAHDALEGLNAFELPEKLSVATLTAAIADAPRPLLVDPFAGGGAIPLEGLRCGADAFASDLNPVAVLLNKVVLEYIPKYGKRLADEVEKWGKWIKEQAEKELAEFYPKDPDGATPIAYLWARTIRCEGPGCGAEVPLMRSMWLCKKPKDSVALQIVPEPDRKRCDFVIIRRENGRWVYQDDPDKVCDNPRFEGTVARGSATCPCCGYTTPVASVRVQLKERHGGADDARMFCVVTTRTDRSGRSYRLPTERDLAAVRKAHDELERRKAAHTGNLSLVPEEPTPMGGGSGAGRAFSQRYYGMDRFCDLFTARQLLALTTLYTRIAAIEVGDAAFAEAVKTTLGFALDKQADLANSLCAWEPIAQCPRHLFGRQAIAMVWDFAEGAVLGESSGSWSVCVNGELAGLGSLAATCPPGTAREADAARQPLPDDSVGIFFTDPPYYDAIPYSDLSDFFYVWEKRCMDLSGAILTPKAEECIVDEVKGKDRAFFETTMLRAMAEGRRVLQPSGIGTVVFAHKSTGGWEAQMLALIDAGWTITASWPVDTECSSRLRAMDSAALASSVHLVCRPREDENGKVTESIGDWRDVLAELPIRITEWLPRLAAEGVVGADAIFACLGPALEIFSRYSSVEKASGETVELREYLEHVWAEVARQALNMIFEGADASGFEEDARLTAMWLWTLRTGPVDGNGEPDDKTERVVGYTLEYDAARKIAQGLGCHLETLGHLVEVKGDKATLLSASSRAAYLFGRDNVDAAPASRKRKKGGDRQPDFYRQLGLATDDELEQQQAEFERPPAGKTVLDQLHQSMLLFSSGRGNALARFLVEDGVGANAQFWVLAQALSALYPGSTEEKRWVDGILARKKGLGF